MRGVTAVLVATEETEFRGCKTFVVVVVFGVITFFVADRVDIERMGCLPDETVLVFPRESVFSPRVAAPALSPQTKQDKIKNRIFFISVCNFIKNMAFRASKITQFLY